MAEDADKNERPTTFSGILLTIRKHYVFFIFMIFLAVLMVLVMVYRPQLPGSAELKGNFFVFGLALQAVVLILIIGIFLLYRWIKTGKQVISTLVWAIAFLTYSSTFFGLLFKSFRTPSNALLFAWADDTIPSIFFLFRQTMIWWIGLMYIGIASIMTKSRIKQIVPGIAFIGLGYLIFGIGLLGFGQIEFTMYAFLYGLWTPLCAAITYCFYLYGRDSKLASPKIIGVGFALLGITYLAWAPWHYTAGIYIYFIWFFAFNISLAIILVGYVMLPYEARAKAALR
jgi:hypothetical protein